MGQCANTETAFDPRWCAARGCMWCFSESLCLRVQTHVRDVLPCSSHTLWLDVRGP